MSFIDPMTQYDEAEAARRQDEDIREQRWTAFVARMRDAAKHYDWSSVVCEVHFAMAGAALGGNSITRDVINFSETEGWPGVLCAIARAMKEADADAAEVERRR